MPRRARSQLAEEGFFHVTGRGTGGCDIFTEDLDRLDFADLFWSAVLVHSWECLVVVEMGTHYHAVLKCNRDDLSAGMRKLNGAYARRFNARHGRRGHLFEDRFSSWLIDDDAYLETTVPYVLWNPVRANLRTSPTNWEWSWLAPARAAAMGSGFEHLGSSDCPMGLSLRRVRERQRRARLKALAAGRLSGAGPRRAARCVEQDEL